MEAKIKINTTSSGYNEVRNFIGLPFSNFGVERSRDFFNFLNFAYFKAFRKNDQRYLNLHLDLGLNGAKINHFFNKISLNKKPWVVTFETALPRWNMDSSYGLKQLSKNNCKKLIAMSECAYQIQMHHLNLHDKYKDEIAEKMVVIHPSQKLLVKNYEEKKFTDDLIHFTMVGAAFFRKGGLDLLHAFERVLKGGNKAVLHIVSAMEYGDYASHTTQSDYEEAMRIINKWPANIIHHERLANHEVLSLLASTHVGLLPTWADTYGYSVLEAQASGCPVITTDIRALPEVNNNEVGWIIKVPKNELGYGEISTPSERGRFSEIVENGIFNSIMEILEKPFLIREKGTRAIDRIAKDHNPLEKASQIESIYDTILAEGPQGVPFGEHLGNFGRKISLGISKATTQAYGVIMKNSFLG